MNDGEREKQIGNRFREAREEANLSQASLAHGLSVPGHNITRDQLASIELGRVPLQSDVAYRFCHFLGVNQRWLATGIGDDHPQVHLPAEIPGVVTSFNFSHVYDTLLAPYCDAFFNLGLESVRQKIKGVSYARAMGQSNESPEQEAELFWKAIQEVLSITLTSVPPSRYVWLFDKVRDLCVDFNEESGPLIEHWRKQSGPTDPNLINTVLGFSPKQPAARRRSAETGKVNSLTSDSAVVNVTPMKQQIQTWQELRARLIELTSERGAKAALARQFNVTPQAVGEWTRGKSMPSADMTIRLLPWVASQESKAKISKTVLAKSRPRR